MKNLFFCVLLLCVTSYLAAQEHIQPLSVGSELPLETRKMKATDGKNYSIKDMKEKNGVLVMFSSNTCPYVVRYQERTRQTLASAKENNIGVIIINSNEGTRNDEDSYKAMMEYANNHGYQHVPYVVDKNSELANAFGATRTPELFLFNAAGKLVYHGAIDDNHVADKAQRSHAKIAMDEMVKGQEVAVKETRSVGCTIKRVKP